MAFPAIYSLEQLKSGNWSHNSSAMLQALSDRYRCPEGLLDCELAGPLSADAGYFRLGTKTVCYGRTTSGYRAAHADSLLYDAQCDVQATASSVLLPFNPDEVCDNLRLERYAKSERPSEWTWRRRLLRDTYYRLRPAMGVSLRKHLQRLHSSRWRRIAFPQWPVDTTVEQLHEELLLTLMKAQGIERIPFVWFWPHGAESCVIMTHDVEDRAGYDYCGELMDIDDAYDIKASFQMVPEGHYRCSDAMLEQVRQQGFELNVQDLNHDGYLFAERNEFLRRAKKINEYGRAFEARGFRSAVLYRNLEWMDALEFSYDMSVPTVAHLDPQHGGCCTVMPYFAQNLLEIPVTTTQDYMLFHLLGDYSLALWKAQTTEIIKKHGLISFIVHPDYIIERRANNVYRELLSWLRELASATPLWFALPGEADEWWRSRSKMRLVRHGHGWKIEGPGADRAVLAFAKVEGDRLEYEVPANLQVVGGVKDSPAGIRP